MRDRLLILPDENHDGVADKAITSARIHNPTGFTFWNGGVVVASAPNIWFLKDTDGDDAAMYIADWANPIIGHMQHNIRDPNRDHGHGRIYRIAIPGRPLQESVAIDGQPIAALLDVLKHPTDGVRLRARIELSERDSGDAIAAAQAWATQFDAGKRQDAHHLLEAL